MEAPSKRGGAENLKKKSVEKGEQAPKISHIGRSKKSRNFDNFLIKKREFITENVRKKLVFLGANF